MLQILKRSREMARAEAHAEARRGTGGLRCKSACRGEPHLIMACAFKEAALRTHSVGTQVAVVFS